MNTNVSFRVKSHVLKLLGDQLIGHDRLAVFELVKNSYDADATNVDVILNIEDEVPNIKILDNGDGMSMYEIEHGWLEIGSDLKRSINTRKRSNKFQRLPLGEKGVGRLAVQKLGEEVSVITKSKNEPEYEFLVNWDQLVNSAQYIGDQLKVSIQVNDPPKMFSGDDTGTQIKINELHNKEWSRKEVRDLYRLVTSLSNPFDKVDSFDVNLLLPNRDSDIKDLPSVKDMLDSAVWVFNFEVSEDGKFSWEYEFKPPRFKGLKHRKSNLKLGKLMLLELDPDLSNLETIENKNIFLTSRLLDGIGPIKGCFYGFYRRSEILKESGSPGLIKEWLDNQTGVKVYRDKVRVFNYGEPGDDWLGLNARRINRPTGKLGTQSVISYIQLELNHSPYLKEKTNREGFDDNEAFRRLRWITLSVFDQFEREHSEDRKLIDEALKGDEQVPGIKIAMNKLELLAKKNDLEAEVKPLLKSIQKELDDFRDLMVSSGMAGMNLALVFHEVVHAIDTIRRKLDAKSSQQSISEDVERLRKLLDTFKPLLQRERVRRVTVKELVDRAHGIHQDRFARHNVVFSNWLNESEKSINFSQTGPLSLLVGAVSNVIDNAIFWVRYRKERDESETPGGILVLSSWDESNGGTLAIVDNGPGFQLPIEQAATAFKSTRAGGMGLGLYYCKLVMDSIGGKFEVMNANELRDYFDFPEIYDGAAFVFSFKGTE